jgi:hypothetical protein
MNILDSFTPVVIGIFFVLMAVMQSRVSSLRYKNSRLNTAIIIFCGTYGFVVLYGVVRGLMA